MRNGNFGYGQLRGGEKTGHCRKTNEIYSSNNLSMEEIELKESINIIQVLFYNHASRSWDTVDNHECISQNAADYSISTSRAKPGYDADM